jgi:hypothetical protein
MRAALVKTDELPSADEARKRERAEQTTENVVN